MRSRILTVACSPMLRDFAALVAVGAFIAGLMLAALPAAHHATASHRSAATDRAVAMLSHEVAR